VSLLSVTSRGAAAPASADCLCPASSLLARAFPRDSGPINPRLLAQPRLVVRGGGLGCGQWDKRAMGKRKKGRGTGEGGNGAEGGGDAGGKRPQDKGRHIHPVETSSWQVQPAVIQQVSSWTAITKTG